jgi:hypothetical protein
MKKALRVLTLLFALLMIVRQWNPNTGKLTVWLPNHQATMVLQYKGSEYHTLKLELSEVIKGKLRNDNTIELKSRVFSIQTIQFKDYN